MREAAGHLRLGRVLLQRHDARLRLAQRPRALVDLALELRVIPGVLEGDGELRAERREQGRALLREGAGHEVVLQREHAEDLILPLERHHQDRA